MSKGTYVPTEKMNGSTHIVVDVDYRKGGANYFSGGTEARGYELSAYPVECKDGFTTFKIGNNQGARFLVRAAARLDRKRLERLREAILPHAPAIAVALENGDKAGIRTLVDGIAAGVK